MKLLLTLSLLAASAAAASADTVKIATHRVTYDQGSPTSFGLMMYSPGYQITSTFAAQLSVNDWPQYFANPSADAPRYRPNAIGLDDVGRTFSVTGPVDVWLPYPTQFNSDWPALVAAVRDSWHDPHVTLSGLNQISGTASSYTVLDYQDIVGIFTDPSAGQVQTFPAIAPTLVRIDFTLEQADRYIVWRSDWWADAGTVPEPNALVMLLAGYIMAALSQARTRDQFNIRTQLVATNHEPTIKVRGLESGDSILITLKLDKPRYSVGTWDTETAAYTPQDAAGPWYNLTRAELRSALKELRLQGYQAHRVRCRDGSYYSDSSVLVERTDGLTPAEVLESWKR